jgi:hypothetical protein
MQFRLRKKIAKAMIVLCLAPLFCDMAGLYSEKTCEALVKRVERHSRTRRVPATAATTETGDSYSYDYNSDYYDSSDEGQTSEEQTDSESSSESSSDSSAESGIKGDLNDDGQVTKADVELMKKYLLETVTKDDINAQNADINGDGEINMTDYSLLSDMAADSTEKTNTADGDESSADYYGE